VGGDGGDMVVVVVMVVMVVMVVVVTIVVGVLRNIRNTFGEKKKRSFCYGDATRNSFDFPGDMSSAFTSSR
jgi:hypothetical protein